MNRYKDHVVHADPARPHVALVAVRVAQEHLRRQRRYVYIYI